MLVYAGIDEAGYGPLLGPLCVAGAAFTIERFDGADGPPNLWSLLRTAICRSRRDRQRRIIVDDSKRVKLANGNGSAHALRDLERGVLSFASTMGDPPADDQSLLEQLGVQMALQPWYASRTPLPLSHTAEELRISGGRLRRCLERAGVQCTMLRCEAIDATEFNHGVQRMGTKSAVNLGAALRLVDAVWRQWPEAHPRVVVDRQGGRTWYLEELQAAWPEAHLRVVAESEALSRYQLCREGSLLTLSFLPESEKRHLPVALASMTAKYLRELMMLRLNRFFTAHLPGLKPTAGYFGDGRRYLEEVGPLVDGMGVPRQHLVRMA